MLYRTSYDDGLAGLGADYDYQYDVVLTGVTDLYQPKGTLKERATGRMLYEVIWRKDLGAWSTNMTGTLGKLNPDAVAPYTGGAPIPVVTTAGQMVVPSQLPTPPLVAPPDAGMFVQRQDTGALVRVGEEGWTPMTWGEVPGIPGGQFWPTLKDHVPANFKSTPHFGDLIGQGSVYNYQYRLTPTGAGVVHVDIRKISTGEIIDSYDYTSAFPVLPVGQISTPPPALDADWKHLDPFNPPGVNQKHTYTETHYDRTKPYLYEYQETDAGPVQMDGSTYEKMHVVIRRTDNKTVVDEYDYFWIHAPSGSFFSNLGTEGAIALGIVGGIVAAGAVATAAGAGAAASAGAGSSAVAGGSGSLLPASLSLVPAPTYVGGSAVVGGGWGAVAAAPGTGLIAAETATALTAAQAAKTAIPSILAAVHPTETGISAGASSLLNAGKEAITLTSPEAVPAATGAIALKALPAALAVGAALSSKPSQTSRSAIPHTPGDYAPSGVETSSRRGLMTALLIAGGMIGGFALLRKRS